MGKLVEKVLNFIGFEVEEEPQELDMENHWPEELNKKSQKNNLVGLPSAAKSVKMAVLKPVKFEQVQTVADHLKNRNPVIVNVEELDLALAKRLIDFLSGTIYALNGSMQKINNGIILFLPNNVDLTGDLNQELEEGIFWSSKSK